MIMRTLISCFTVFVVIGCYSFSFAGEVENPNIMDKVYRDESHCLLVPEIRGKQDNPISCPCRDAIMDARYIYQNYLLTKKDLNLNGIYLTLVDHAQEICAEKYDNIYKNTIAAKWQWNGPKVKRQYPPEREINRIQPDNKGFRTVEYKVTLTYVGASGRVIKFENFTAREILPPNIKK